MKASIFSSKGPAMAVIAAGNGGGGTGFLIHRNLLLTTHVNLPSAAAAEAAEIRIQNGAAACLFPHRLARFAFRHYVAVEIQCALLSSFAKQFNVYISIRFFEYLFRHQLNSCQCICGKNVVVKAKSISF